MLLLKIHFFTTGYRIPVVYRAKNTFIPIFLPFTYGILKIKDKAFITRRRHQTAIDELYRFFEDKGIELDEVLISGQFYLLFDHLHEFFMVYLYSRQDKKTLSPQVFTAKVKAIKEYLHWNFIRYVHLQVATKNQDRIDGNLELRLKTFFESYTSSIHFSRKNYKSLSEQEVVHLLGVVHPESESNPFSPEHRIRNYLLIKIFLCTGIRLGELLLLKSTSLVQGNNSFYIKIAYSFGEEDTRIDRPDLKNSHSERIIAINKDLFELCDYYILQLRRPVKKGKRMNLAHGFLFASQLGKPLAKSTVSDIFQKINNTLFCIDNQTAIRITPHVLRHTFADSFLQYLIDVRHLDMARAKDELRAVCGWSADSVMPLHYAGRYISKIANQHNLDRIATTYTIYEQQP